MTLDSIAAPAAATIRRESRGFALARLAHDPDYERDRVDATWYVGGVRHEITVASDGRLVDSGIEVSVAEVPAVVVESAQRVFETSELRYLRLTSGKYLVQKVTGRDGRRKHELVFRLDGDFESKTPDCDSDLE
jgi:hypothetical protein